MPDHTDVAREYYRRIDGGAYDALGTLLDDSFVHVRPDRTLEGRDRFVQFMREERPNPDTSHVVETVFVGARDHEGDGERVAVEGRLETYAGETMFRFVDTFDFEAERIERIRTYTD